MNISSNYNEETAKCFLKLRHAPNITFLIYRDIPDLIKKYVSLGKALDFGCGPGISTRFFSSLGFEVIGIDINKNMLKEAISEPDGIPFAWIRHGKFTFSDNSFDLVTSIMVLLEMPNLKTMKEAIDEIYRVLKPGGIFLVIVGSEHFHKYEWVNKIPVEQEKYQNLNTGDEFYTYSKVTGITFKDYFYTNQNYITTFNEAGFEVLTIHKALAREDDEIPCALEKKLNPFTHYVCKKGY
jgi:ubiquinone/menaquinone biosynthesis C-methylase UbiE